MSPSAFYFVLVTVSRLNMVEIRHRAERRTGRDSRKLSQSIRSPFGVRKHSPSAKRQCKGTAGGRSPRTRS